MNVLIRLAGPPLTEHTAISRLLSANVSVGLGILENWSARNTRLDVGWVNFMPFIVSEILLTRNLTGGNCS